jgi:hypothetical protein
LDDYFSDELLESVFGRLIVQGRRIHQHDFQYLLAEVSDPVSDNADARLH